MNAPFNATREVALAQLEVVGPVLARLGHHRVSLSWECVGGEGFYFIDGRDEQGRYFKGAGNTPGEALTSAEEDLARRFSGGWANA